MKIDSKVKGGLAWAGLFVILAVPSADLLFGSGDAANANLAVTSDTRAVAPALKAPAVKSDPVETASIASPAAKTADPVDTYLSEGKELPSYISDGGASTPAAKPAAPALVVQPAAVASVAPAEITPPVPLPRDARPKVAAPVVASVPATPSQPALIIDESELAQREAALGAPATPAPPASSVEPFPLSDGGSSRSSTAAADDEEVVVTGDQLEEWDSGSLADYLERKGLMSNGSQADDEDEQYVFNQGPSRPRRPVESFFLF